jgi:hypothetical protein
VYELNKRPGRALKLSLKCAKVINYCVAANIKWISVDFVRGFRENFVSFALDFIFKVKKIFGGVF